MDAELVRLSAEHRAKLPASFDSTAVRRAMFEEYTSRDQDLITDATAIATALSATVLSRRFSPEDLSLEAREAFTLAFPHLDVSALTSATREQLERWIGPWKARLFDVLVRDAKSVTGHVRCQVTGRNPTLSVSRSPASAACCQGLNRNTAITPMAAMPTATRLANGDMVNIIAERCFVDVSNILRGIDQPQRG